MKNCLILDYGVGNIASLRTFFRENGYVVTFGKEIEDIQNTELLILPGVGSFKLAAKNIKNDRLKAEIRNRHYAQKPIVGICLGFQLLMMNSDESTDSRGLGIIDAEATRLKEYSKIGWDKLNFETKEDSLSNEYFYFNHSFGAYNVKNSDFEARTGQSNYLAVVAVSKTVGVQFHPERSQQSGKVLLRWIESKIWNLNA